MVRAAAIGARFAYLLALALDEVCAQAESGAQHGVVSRHRRPNGVKRVPHSLHPGAANESSSIGIYVL